MKCKTQITFCLCVLCVLALLLSSCQTDLDSWKFVQLKGEAKSVTVPLEDGGGGIGLSFELNFTDGGANTITVLPPPDGEEPYAVLTYPADLEDYGLTAVMKNGILTVDTERNRQFSTDAFSMTVYADVISYDLVGNHSLKADLGGKEMPLLSLHITGGAAVQMTDVAADALSVLVDGAADVVLSGTAKRLDAEINGATALESTALAVSHASVIINGAGAAEVACSETLDAEINGAGRIGYVGDPTVNKEINGVGAVTKRSDDAS